MKKSSVIIFFLLIISFLNAQNNCLDFDGTDDYVEVSSSSSINFGSGDFSITLWVNSSSSNNGTIIEKIWDTWSSTGGNGWAILLLDNGRFRFSIADTPGEDPIDFNSIAGTQWNNGNWHHLAIVVDRDANVIFYIDGIADRTGDVSSESGSLSNTYPLLIGINYNKGATKDYAFNGKIEEVSLWNTALTEAEIRANMYRKIPNPTSEINLVAYYQFNETSGTNLPDESSNSNNGTLYNMTNDDWVTSGAFAGPRNCLLFDGVDEYIDIGMGPTTVQSVEFWVYPTTTTEYFIDLNGSAYILSNSGTILATGFTSPTIYVDCIESTTIVSGKWQHIAVTTGTSINTTDLDIGRLEGQEEFDGKIDEVRLWSDVRTATEIHDNMCHSLDGDENGLVAYYRFDQKNISGQTTLYDITSNNNHGILTNMEATADWVDCEAFDTWIGWLSNSWTTSANWSDGVPTATDNVGIPYWILGHSPTSSGSPTVNNLVIGLLATLNLASDITINGHYFELGTLSPGTNTVTFGGSSKQYLTGINLGFYNLTINNTHAGDKVSARWCTSLSVSNNLTMTDGIFYSKSDYNNVSIGTNGTLELSGDITVSGNWDNDGTFTHNNHTVTFDGSSTQTIQGDNTTTFHNLTINSGAIVNINTGGEVTVSNTLSNSGTFTIKSSASGTGSLIESSGVSATVERYITQNIYHYLSSPVSSQALSLLQSGTPLTDFDLFWYDEDYGGSQGPTWINASSQGGNIDVGLGYAYNYKLADRTLEFSGTTNTGNITEPITYTYNSIVSSDPWYFGWNIVGNPYPSRINATTFIDDTDNSSIYGTLYLWDQAGSYNGNRNDYATWNKTGATAGGGGQTPNGYIDIGQAFMVHTTTASTSISFKNDMRVHNAAQFFKGEIQRFKISVENAEEDYNETLIGFLENTTPGFDNKYDGYKLKGNSDLALYTKLVEDDGYDYAIQGLPPLTDGVTVKLGIDAGSEGNYTFNLVDIENFHDTTSIFLEDLYEDVVVDLRKIQKYTFNLEEPGSYTDRFLLHFNAYLGVDDNNFSVNNEVRIYSFDKSVYIKRSMPGNFSDIVQVYNILGQEILNEHLNSSDLVKIDLETSPGYYIVKVITDQRTYVSRVYVNGNL